MICMTSYQRTEPLAISLFTGAGGLDIGMERSGFKVLSTLEIDSVFCETLKTNQNIGHNVKGYQGRKHLEGTKIICKDIRNVDYDELGNKSLNIDCIFGGPPCQTFSSAGKMGSVFDDRGRLYLDFVNVVGYFKPKTFLLENVRGLVTARGRNWEPGEVLRQIVSDFENIGYSCRVSLLNSADYGAPQRRVRCFILGSRGGEAPQFPEPTHKNKWISLGNFLKANEDHDKRNWVEPTPEMERKIRKLPEGTGLRSPGIKEPTRPGGHWGYKQGGFIADMKLPSRTISGSTSQDWIRTIDGELRRLTLKEVTGIQCFPAGWQFCGSKAQKFKQVGNAVPTVFGEAIGKSLINHIQKFDSTMSPVRIELPKEIEGYMKYTKREQSRNGEARKIKMPII